MTAELGPLELAVSLVGIETLVGALTIAATIAVATAVVIRRGLVVRLRDERRRDDGEP